MVLPLWGLISWGATVASKQQSHWGKRQKSTLLFSRAQLMDRRTPKRNRSASWGLRDADRLRRPSLCLVKVSFCEGDNIGGLTMRLVSATPFHLLHIVGWKQVAHAQKWRRAGQLPRVNFSSDYCRHSRGMWSPYLSVPYGSSLQKLFERNLRKARPSSWKRCEPFFFFFPPSKEEVESHFRAPSQVSRDWVLFRTGEICQPCFRCMSSTSFIIRKCGTGTCQHKHSTGAGFIIKKNGTRASSSHQVDRNWRRRHETSHNKQTTRKNGGPVFSLSPKKRWKQNMTSGQQNEKQSKKKKEKLISCLTRRRASRGSSRNRRAIAW